MAAKKKAKKKKPVEKEKETPEAPKSEDEEVIEVKTTAKKEPDEKETEKEEPIADTPKPGISSFSQLDADTSSGEETEKEKEKEEVKEEPKEEESEEETEKEEEDETEKEETSAEEAKKWLKGVSPEIETESSSEKGSKKKTILIIIVIALLLGVIAGGFYYYRSKVSDETGDKAEPTQAPSQVTATPTPTVFEEEDVELTDYSVSVLNGSGVPGEAGVVNDLLTDSGFSEIDTGNAESYDFVQTEVSVKEDTPEAVYAAIEAALEDSYDVSKSETALDEDSSFDVIIIVGTKK